MEGMIFAAGLGTRLKPITDNKPKALVEINGKTLLEHTVEKFVKADIRHIVINVHHFAYMMKKYIKQLSVKYDCKLIISDESDLLLDTGGGLINAKKYFSLKDDILVHNVDILSDFDAADCYRQFTLSDCIAMLAVSERPTVRYFIFNEENLLSGWVNTSTNQKILTRNSKKDTLLAFSGIQIVSRKIFEKTNKTGVFSIKDMYLELSEHYPIMPYIHQGKWIDCGKIESLETAAKMF